MSVDDKGTRQIIVRLAKARTSDASELSQVAKEEGFESLSKFLGENPHITSERVIYHVDPARVRAREKIAKRTFAHSKSLTAYWRLDASREKRIPQILDALNDMLEIEIAYEQTRVLVANPAECPSVTDNPWEGKQKYLNAAPTGIDARAAWCKPNGQGEGVNAVDIEQAWIKYHQDLPEFNVLTGTNGIASDDQVYNSRHHGAASLGVVGALNNKLGVIGIAPKLASLNVSSHYRIESLSYPIRVESNLHVADAIYAATTSVSPGDVLLIEVQRSQMQKGGLTSLPVEIDPADLCAIRLATALGIVVIEAAGNDNFDLDAWEDPLEEHSLDMRGTLSERLSIFGKLPHSGAIMVGAAFSDDDIDSSGRQGHERYFTSNYGSRIDCYAWGKGVYTAGGGDAVEGETDETKMYTKTFSQTSAATAIIAGAACVVQSWVKGRYGLPLDPTQMRYVLSNPTRGTKQVKFAGDPIGVMPDLKRLLTSQATYIGVLLTLWRRLRRRLAHPSSSFS